MKRNLFLLLLTALSPTIQASVFETGTPDEIVTAIDNAVKNKKTDTAFSKDIVHALNDSNTNIRVRERAAWALGELQVKTATPALLQAAQHKGLLIRSAALDALIRLRTRSALSTFTEIADNDPILSLRQRATLALGLLQWDKAIPQLVKLSSDNTPEVQGAAALAMAATQSKKNDFSEALKEMAGEEDAYVKLRAQKALEVVNKKNTAVREQLESDDVDIRLFAALYFHNHGTASDLTAVKDAANGEADGEVRYELNQAIAAIKKRAAEAKTKASQTKKKSISKSPSSSKSHH